MVQYFHHFNLPQQTCLRRLRQPPQDDIFCSKRLSSPSMHNPRHRCKGSRSKRLFLGVRYVICLEKDVKDVILVGEEEGEKRGKGGEKKPRRSVKGGVCMAAIIARLTYQHVHTKLTMVPHIEDETKCTCGAKNLQFLAPRKRASSQTSLTHRARQRRATSSMANGRKSERSRE